MAKERVQRRVVDAIDSIIEQCTGFTFPPVRRAIRAAEWTPDVATDYCRRCGDSVGEGESAAAGCGTCREGAELAGGIADGVVRLGPYADSLREWVRAIKFHRWTEMGECMGELLGKALLEAKAVDPARTVIVPMPMPWMRRMYRGVDHTRVIACGVATPMRAPVIHMLRKRNQPPQVSLVPSERRRRGGRGLSVRWRWGGWPLQGLHIVLVDDVRTTGATLKAGARLLKSLKPERVVCAVIAVSDDKARRLRSAQTRVAHTEGAAPDLPALCVPGGVQSPS